MADRALELARQYARDKDAIHDATWDVLGALSFLTPMGPSRAVASRAAAPLIDQAPRVPWEITEAINRAMRALPSRARNDYAAIYEQSPDVFNRLLAKMYPGDKGGTGVLNVVSHPAMLKALDAPTTMRPIDKAVHFASQLGQSRTTLGLLGVGAGTTAAGAYADAIYPKINHMMTFDGVPELDIKPYVPMPRYSTDWPSIQ